MNEISDITGRLTELAEIINKPENHLKTISVQNKRLETFSSKGGGIFYDYSRQRVNSDIMDALFELSRKMNVRERFRDMANGEKLNISEKRAALHTAMRSKKEVFHEGVNITGEVQSIRAEIKEFSEKIREGSLKGSTEKRFDTIVVVGIGGSLLGTKFVYDALKKSNEKKIETFFLGGVDLDNFNEITGVADPEKTLWIAISKSFSTIETLSNLNQIKAYLVKKGLKPENHLVTISNNSNASENCLKSFSMFDFIGGRYSVTSVVGGLPLSISLGYEVYERFLDGAFEMDIHAEEASEKENTPLLAAMISLWNNHYLNYNTIGVIPYSARLKELVPHLQQLSMESNGKSVDVNGDKLNKRSGTILFGYQGTDAQHSFFQLAHQGQTFPIEFIGVVKDYNGQDTFYKGVSTHQELWANMISQARTLAEGFECSDSEKCFEGNRPSSTILVESVSPENIGRLLSFYEAKTVYEAFLLGINPFDQFGVELGKKNAETIRDNMAKMNKGEEKEKSDDITDFYIDTLFSGNL